MTVSDKALAQAFRDALVDSQDGAHASPTYAALSEIYRRARELDADKGGEDRPFPNIANKVIAAVLAQREEILRAFVAKYGFQPDEAMQVSTPNGWYITRRQATPPAQAAEAVRVTKQMCYRAIDAYTDAVGEGWQQPCVKGMYAALDAAIAAMSKGE